MSSKYGSKTVKTHGFRFIFNDCTTNNDGIDTLLVMESLKVLMAPKRNPFSVPVLDDRGTYVFWTVLVADHSCLVHS
jgi:hypothetical protein